MIRSKPIRRTSKGLWATKRTQRRVYQQAAGEAGCCRACGGNRDLSPSHVLTQKQFPAHRANPKNVVWLCWQPCHALWENNKAEFCRQYPEAWAVKMAIMQGLEPGYYELFQLKHKALFQTHSPTPNPKQHG